MVKLNNIYFTSQIKDLIFYQKEQIGEGSPEISRSTSALMNFLPSKSSGVAVGG
jgi:hypothetical protein